MTINLSSYPSIAAGLLVRIQIDNYRTTNSGAYSQEILTFSDWNETINYDGEDYLGLGKFVGITASTSELKSSSGSITITISGIPNSSIAEIVNSQIKGSPISVYRILFDATTLDILDLPANPVGRFFGIINNYSLDEDYDVETRTSTNTISLICSSLTEVLDNKVAGRKTNSASQKSFYPFDVSMDRVTSLVGANFNFGAPK